MFAGYTPNEDTMRLARAANVGTVEVSHDPMEAVKGADVIYTDVWASMGQKHEADQRKLDFTGFQVCCSNLEIFCILCISTLIVSGAPTQAYQPQNGFPAPCIDWIPVDAIPQALHEETVKQVQHLSIRSHVDRQKPIKMYIRDPSFLPPDLLKFQVTSIISPQKPWPLQGLVFVLYQR